MCFPVILFFMSNEIVETCFSHRLGEFSVAEGQNTLYAGKTQQVLSDVC